MPEQRTPAAANSVAVQCGEVDVSIEVNQNFLGNGQLIRPSDVTLGGCAALHVTDHVLHFRVELQDCGSTLKMTEKTLIYTFSLIYSPEPIGSTLVFKTNPAEVLIECHYPRKHYVSSDALMPTWMPFASSILKEQHLHFSLRFMTEDWRWLRPSNIYYLGDVLHIEASVLQGWHVPLRVFVDRCVATPTPNLNTELTYPFISNHGCLTDAKLTGAKSYFMQRSQEDKLHFQLKAFRFHQDDSNSLFITCHVKATTLSVPIDSEHKACSFLTEANRWVASGGDNKVCGCCESRCSQQRLKRSPAADAAALEGDSPRMQWEGTASLRAILLEEPEAAAAAAVAAAAGTVPPDPPQMLGVTGEAASASVTVMCGVGAALAVVLLVFMGAVISSRAHKPTVHVCT